MWYARPILSISSLWDLWCTCSRIDQFEIEQLLWRKNCPVRQTASVRCKTNQSLLPPVSEISDVPEHSTKDQFRIPGLILIEIWTSQHQSWFSCLSTISTVGGCVFTAQIHCMLLLSTPWDHSSSLSSLVSVSMEPAVYLSLLTLPGPILLLLRSAARCFVFKAQSQCIAACEYM